MGDIFRETLKKYWGYDDFRGIQREIIESIASGRDTLGLMPTGGGKSITFQVPTLAGEGLCLVITPLVALMKDQVMALKLRGINATAVYNGMKQDEIIAALENCILGGYRFLYVSPERLASEYFLWKARKMPISLITVDEAHCISQWGYDFRPSYLKINEIRKLFPKAPVLALTATATKEVVEDIQKRLDFKEPNVFRMSFERKNLTYVVRNTEDKPGELLHILNSYAGSAIVYTRNRRETAEVAKFLKENKITALNYHAGLTRYDKDLRQKSWNEGETRVMVATNAFGMGIDKADVRLVIHMESPDSPEAYFQEAGRAGRDGRQAYAVLLYNKGDRTKLLRRVPQNFPPISTIRNVYDHMAYFFELAVGDGYNVSYDFNLTEFCTRYHFFPETVESSLHILTRAGYIRYSEEEDTKPRVVFMVGREELYRLHNTSPDSESVIQALLRNYGGVFTDYVFIDEQVLANYCGMQREQIIEILKGLSHQRIIHFIPHKRTPRVTYLQRRVLSEELVISKEVYEQRKEEYATRIQAMLDYCEKDECHSRFLLNYFGEKDAQDCGKCEVCLARKHNKSPKTQQEKAVAAINSILGDRLPHFAAEITVSGISTSAISETLQRMVQNGEVAVENGRYRLNA